LERNPATRQIIGELNRQEQSEKEQQENHLFRPQESPGPVKPESNTVIQQWMNRIETSSIPMLADDDDDTFLCNANDYNEVLSDDALDDDEQNHDEQLPEQPQTEPSPTAALQGITVQFDTRVEDNPQFVGKNSRKWWRV
jgi:hypothetical protein